MILLKIVTPLIERNSGFIFKQLLMNDRQNRPSFPPPPPPAVFYIGVSAQAGGQEPGDVGRQDGVPLVVSLFKNICPPLPLYLPTQRKMKNIPATTGKSARQARSVSFFSASTVK